MKKLLPLWFILACAGRLFAADVADDFAAANKLYAEGKFTGSASAYEKMLQAGAQSPALLFNAANAEYKAGNLGKAIANYGRAEQLAPHDAEIRANLAFVRNQVQGATVRPSYSQTWLGQFSLNEWTVLAVVAFWLFFAVLAFRQIRPALAGRLRSATWVLAGLTFFFGAGLGLQAMNHSRQTAIVLSDGTAARSGPFDEAQSTFTLHDGAELTVVDHHENWVQVADASGKTGWLSAKQVALLPGA